MGMRGNDVRRLDQQWVRDLFKEEHLFLAVNTSVGVMRYLGGEDQGDRRSGQAEGEVTQGVCRASWTAPLCLDRSA